MPRLLLVICLAACVGSIAHAQTDDLGTVAGVVTNAVRAPLTGVTVTATGDAPGETERMTHTDAAGRYEIAALPTGSYTIAFSNPGSKTVERRNVQVHASVHARIDAELPRGEPREIVVLTAPVPLIDTRSVASRRVVTQEFVKAIPTSSLFTTIGVLIPGMSATGSGQRNYQDVGGSVGLAQGVLAIHGGRFSDQVVTLDGLSVGTWDRSGSVSSLGLPDHATLETTITYAAHPGWHETGGVVVNFVPQTGGNTIRGDVVASGTAARLQFNNRTSDLEAAGLRTQNRIKYIADMNAAAGGPLVRTRAWFAADYRRRSRVLWLPAYYDTNPSDWVYVPSASRQATDDERESNGGGRITVRTLSHSTASFNYVQDAICNCHWLITPRAAPEAAEHALTSTRMAQARWRSAPTDRLFMDVRMSRLRAALASSPQPEAVGPAAIDGGLSNLNLRSRATFGPDGYRDIADDRMDVRGSISYTTGSRAVMVGSSAERGRRRSAYYSLGDYSVTLQNGLPRAVTYLGGPASAIDELATWATFAQGRWTAHRITVDAGVRFDRLSTSHPPVTLPATPLLPRRDFAASDVLNWKDVSPRIGAVYDLFGDGRTAVKTAISRFVLQEGLEITQAVDPAGTARLTGNTRRWNDVNNDFIPQGDPLNPEPNGELGRSGNRDFGAARPPMRIDPAVARGINVRPSQREVSATLEHQFTAHVSVAAAYISRIYGHFTVADDINLSPADFDGPYCVTIPPDPHLPAGGKSLCGLFDLAPSRPMKRVDRVLSAASRYGRQSERWNGIDLTGSARLATLWLQGGMSTGKTITDNCDVISKVDDPTTLDCHVETAILSDVKFLATYQLPWRTRVGATFQSSPGRQVSAIYLFSDLPGLGRVTSSPTGVTSVNLIRPGTRFGDRVNQTNVRVARRFGFGRRIVELRVDVYNALNANTVLTWNDIYGSTAPSLTWLTPESIMQARVMTLGIHMNW